ncbi:hypothetical protein TNCV_3100441 [Trichonephila clavipes]|nr:hypothetical protein TNCV_3100441 [Trichonephila clavipes]
MEKREGAKNPLPRYEGRQDGENVALGGSRSQYSFVQSCKADQTTSHSSRALVMESVEILNGVQQDLFKPIC